MNKKEKKEGIVIPLYYNFFKHPRKATKDFFRTIKFYYQRAKYGVSDWDIWDFDSYLTRMIPYAIERLADITHGHPSSMTMEEWDSILRDIVFNFREGEMWADTNNKYANKDGFCPDNPEQAKLYWNEEKRIVQYRYDCRQKALSLLAKYFDDLWD